MLHHFSFFYLLYTSAILTRFAVAIGECPLESDDGWQEKTTQHSSQKGNYTYVFSNVCVCVITHLCNYTCTHIQTHIHLKNHFISIYKQFIVGK